MLPNMNLSEAKQSTVEAGGYVLRILETEIDTKNNRLQLKVDIVEGPNQGYYTKLNAKHNFWALYANLPLDADAAWKFANAIEALRASNADFEWNDDGENDEHKMVGMYVGGILQRKHYIGNDGKKKSKALVYRLIPVEDVRNGVFEIPEDRYDNGLGPMATAAPAGVVDTTAGQPGPVPGFYEQDPDDNPF